MRSTRLLGVLALSLAFLHLLAVAHPVSAPIGDNPNPLSPRYQQIALTFAGPIDSAAVPGGCSTRCGIALIPSQLVFAGQPVGTTSKPLGIRLINDLPTSLTVGAVSTTGPFHATSGCPKVLPSRQACFFEVTFHPLAKGASNGFMKVRLGGVIRAVPLSGTGQ